MAGPAGLDFGVIMEIAGIMDIEISQTFFEKLRAYEVTVLGQKGSRIQGFEDSSENT